MSEALINIIEASKKHLSKTFFRIVKVDDSYIIKEYKGVIKSVQTMMYEGWNRHQYLANFINEDYPVFKLSDFKSTNGFTIEKKSENELLKAELMEFIEYFNLNQNLYLKMKELKQFIVNFLSISFTQYEKFSDLNKSIETSISSLTISSNEKIKFQFSYVSLVNDIYLELDKLNIEKSRLFFENKFKYFLSIIKD